MSIFSQISILRYTAGMKRAVFLGRYSPFHKGHEYIMRQKLDEGVPLLVLVRDTPLDDKNPYTAAERKEMIDAAFEDEDVVVMIVPDVEGIYYGRKVGYKVEQFDPPQNIKNISATDIRNSIREGRSDWKEVVNPATANWLESYYDQGNEEKASS